MPIALLLLFALLTSAAAADPASEEPFAGYADLCGHEIRVERTAYLSKAQIVDGVPLIVIDPSLLRPRQAFHRVFLIAHECAHHRMKHTSRAGLAKRNTARHGIRDQEMSADCWAAETLTRAGMLEPLLEIADQFWRRGFVSPGGGYPSGIQRSNVIRHCSRIAVEKMEDLPPREGSIVRLWHPGER